jgi:spore coat protein U-like protein
MKPHHAARSMQTRAACAAVILAALLSPLTHAAVTSCTVSASGVAFGNYMADSPTTLTSSGTINVNCVVVNGRNPVTVALSAGSSGSFAQRTLISGGNFLHYNLYLDAAYMQIWGDGTAGSLTDTVSVTHGRPNFSATVYGQIFALQDVAAGTYTDTITVSVSY